MVYLEDDDLGRLDLDCDTGFVVAGLDIGFPVPREIVRPRSLADGIFDDTRYLGSRIVTVTMRMMSGGCDPVASSQTLIDQVMPYLSPRKRVRLAWSIQRNMNEVRSVVVRGYDAPVLIESRAFPTVAFQFVSVGAYLELAQETCFIRNPNLYTPEEGRDYDLTFDRQYVPGFPGDAVVVFNPGNSPANWTATILATAIQPRIIVNGTIIETNRNGGVTLIAGQTLTIDTEDRTAFLNNDPTLPRYDRLNFEDWSWDDLLLQPGVNVFRFNGVGAWFDINTRLEICTRGAWL
jgi:hypothetical protein